jgi:hypothetical protein
MTAHQMAGRAERRSLQVKAAVPLLVCLAGVVQVDHPPVVGEQFVN